MLTQEMQTLIENYRAGMVATVNDDGTPSVSPKGTFVVIDDKTLAFANIRSPGTIANLNKRPQVEVCFIDVLSRKAVRVTGSARIQRKGEADDAILSAFQPDWADYMDIISMFVVIDVSAVELITSPAYDLGFSEQELRQTNLDKLNAL